MTATVLLAPKLAGDVPLLATAIAALMYWFGGRRLRTGRRRGMASSERIAQERRRSGAFFAALAVIVLALGEPLDELAGKLFWAHMVQHVLLLVVAAPLIVLAAPWMRLWRAFPLGMRRPLARAAVQSRWAAPLRALAGACGTPVVAFTLMNLNILAWHVPAAYDLALRNSAVHYAEHASFIVLALIGWAQVIDSPPYRSKLDLPHRGAFVLGSLIAGWLLALALGFSGSAWYAAYANIAHRPGGLSALADQHLAAGVMWVPASLPWSLALFVLIYRWAHDVETARRVHA